MRTKQLEEGTECSWDLSMRDIVTWGTVQGLFLTQNMLCHEQLSNKYLITKKTIFLTGFSALCNLLDCLVRKSKNGFMSDKVTKYTPGIIFSFTHPLSGTNLAHHFC